MDLKKTVLICTAILVAGALSVLLIFSTEPEAEQSGATKQTAMLVEVTEVEQGDFRPTITTTGVVRAARAIGLQPRVSGEVIERSPDFDPGGFVEKGELLMRIDPADYEIAVDQQRSALRQAEADLRIEMGLQKVARREYELLEDTLSDSNKELLLREPQLARVRSQVEAARANLKQAELDLKRTAIRAPFNAQIVSRNADIGSQVSPGQDLGRVIGLDNYWVQASVPVSRLKWLTFSEEDPNTASEVRIMNRSAGDTDLYRMGTLYRLIGALEEDTRLARVLINVPDPLALQQNDQAKSRLIIGSFVEVNIEGRELTDVVRMDRSLLRDGNTVWVMENGSLEIREVEVVFSSVDHAYISEGLNEEDRVVSTNLATVVDGAPLRLNREENDVNGSGE